MLHAGKFHEEAVRSLGESHISEVYFLKLDLLDAAGKIVSTNTYWQNDYTKLDFLLIARLDVNATQRTAGKNTIFDVTVRNPTAHIGLMAHLQLHDAATGKRVLPVFY